jgi:hypothetical protein
LRDNGATRPEVEAKQAGDGINSAHLQRFWKYLLNHDAAMGATEQAHSSVLSRRQLSMTAGD